MPFPVVKLAYLGLKQVSRPIARAVKERAKISPFLRNYILLPPAQWYHALETSVKLRLLGLGKASNVRPMNDEMAVELAAEMLGELVVFSVATGTIYWEYRRQTNRDQDKEDTQNERLVSLESKLQDLGLQLEKQNAQLRELNRLVLSNEHSTDRTNVQAPSSGDLPQKIVDTASGTVLHVHKS